MQRLLHVLVKYAWPLHSGRRSQIVDREVPNPGHVHVDCRLDQTRIEANTEKARPCDEEQCLQ